jgi:DNA (cytosine-5)-methyltransferase 1
LCRLGRYEPASGLRVGDADLLIGGPPCQPFSKSGYWARGDTLRLNDPRSYTLEAYLRVLEEARPRAFLLENVDGFMYTEKSEGLGLLITAIEEINNRVGTRYEPAIQVLNAADFGVPQARRRLFVVASRDGGTPFRFPRDLSEIVPSEVPRRAPNGTPYYRCAWDAIGDIVLNGDEDLVPSSKWSDLLPSIPEGKNYLWHTNRGKGLPLFGWRTRYWGFLLKLAKSRPAWTIPAQPGPAIGPFHWTSRRLSRRELCRLQTFPDRVQIAGNMVSAQRQAGNAVPSLLAEVLGREIMTQFLGHPAPSGPPTLLPACRQPIPPAEDVAPVPARYLAQAGRHEPHPGTGKGPGAVARNKAAAMESLIPAT